MKSFSFFIMSLILAGIILTNCFAQDLPFPSQEDVKELKSGQFQHLVKRFLLTGQVDDSMLEYQSINFEPKQTYQDTAKSFINKIKD